MPENRRVLTILDSFRFRPGRMQAEVSSKDPFMGMARTDWGVSPGHNRFYLGLKEEPQNPAPADGQNGVMYRLIFRLARGTRGLPPTRTSRAAAQRLPRNIPGNR